MIGYMFLKQNLFKINHLIANFFVKDTTLNPLSTGSIISSPLGT